MTLSRNRAESVAGYLSTHGVARARIGTQGFGETQPVAANDTDAGRAQNRRVEIKLVPVADTNTQGCAHENAAGRRSGRRRSPIVSQEINAPEGWSPDRKSVEEGKKVA